MVSIKKLNKSILKCHFCGERASFEDTYLVSEEKNHVCICPRCKERVNLGPNTFSEIVHANKSYNFTRIYKMTVDRYTVGRYFTPTRANQISLWHPREKLIVYNDYILSNLYVRNWPHTLHVDRLLEISDVPHLRTLPEQIEAKVIHLQGLDIESLQGCEIKAKRVYCRNLRNLKKLPEKANILNRMIFVNCPEITDIPENINYNIEVDTTVIDRIPKNRLPLYLNVVAGNSEKHMLERLKENA